jgi:hypothetical protein
MPDQQVPTLSAEERSMLVALAVTEVVSNTTLTVEQAVTAMQLAHEEGRLTIHLWLDAAGVVFDGTETLVLEPLWRLRAVNAAEN